MHVFVFVYLGVCVGTDDGAQEVVKEILEDVVTSAIKGKNQEPSLSFYPSPPKEFLARYFSGRVPHPPRTPGNRLPMSAQLSHGIQKFLVFSG